ncbi:PH domain-containing protein [Pseudarthrobacter equi]|uniref:PH domain-containing protein n=1 Tax=Pseudarthrobacter equi TaxID=728066 RepID=UPI0021BF88EB|nr:PH domain-containing protein [Pseudarthrobacter equi]MCT9626442.1 PH domain-containing protein [Pseudarthrobacter equi]
MQEDGLASADPAPAGSVPGASTAAADSAGPGVATPDDGWLRVHPASPFVRGWVALAAIGFFFGRDIFERTLQGRPMFEDGFAGRVPWLVAGGGAVLLVAVLSFVLTWYFTKYQVSGGYVRVNTGFLFRQQRQARLDRVQAIDIVQPLLARIFGLAELKFEVADAGESAVRLAYLKIDDAQQLRATILARAAGIDDDAENPGAPAPEAPEYPVLSVPPSRLIGSLLLSEQSLFVVVGGVASVVLSAVTDNRAFYFYLIPAALGLAASYWNLFNKGYNFTAAISPDGIRLRYGLLDTQAQTLPPGRIQALKISQPPLWRPFGWYRMQVNVAGYGLLDNAGEASSRTTLLPVGKLDDAMNMLALVLPDPGTSRPAEVFGAGLTGLDSDGGFVTTPRRARLLAPLGWRRNGFAATDTALLIRSGRWWRNLVLVPHQRTQSMALHQGPLARRFRVADLVLHTTAGPVVPRLTQAGLDEARALFDEQSARARLARQRQTTEQWLRQVAPPGADPDSQAAETWPLGNEAHQQQEGPQHG